MLSECFASQVCIHPHAGGRELGNTTSWLRSYAEDTASRPARVLQQAAEQSKLSLSKTLSPQLPSAAADSPCMNGYSQLPPGFSAIFV